MELGPTDLARQQAELVAALVAGGADPAGVDPDRLAATREALLRKRTGEVATAWPALAPAFGDRWPAVFHDWARGRIPNSPRADALAFAAAHREAGDLPPELNDQLRRATRHPNRLIPLLRSLRPGRRT